MKRLLLLILLLPATICYADVGVVATKSGVVVAKEVYAGDVSDLNRQLSDRTAADPTLTFQTFTLPNSAFDATLVPLNQVSLRTAAADLLVNDPGAHSKFVRAVLLVMLDEINTIRATPGVNLTPRTVAQMRTAVQAKLNSGVAD